ncbi:MAG: hypothetical protein WDO18_18870 [Acidobacteriota bacterium]
MSRRIAAILAFNIVLVVGAVSTLIAQQPVGPAAAKGAVKGKGGTPGKQVAPRAGLFFKEEWKQNEGGSEKALSQANIANADLELKLYGCGGPEGLLMTGFDNSDPNPTPYLDRSLREPQHVRAAPQDQARGPDGHGSRPRQRQDQRFPSIAQWP